jgi:hypothetical protein
VYQECAGGKFFSQSLSGSSAHFSLLIEEK